MLEHYLYLIFGILSIIFGFFMISSKNPLYSVLFLVLIFICVAFLLLILGAEFLALLFLVVYVGAVAVLFLFVVMMLKIRMLEWGNISFIFLFFCFILGVIFFIECFVLLNLNFNNIFYTVNFLKFIETYNLFSNFNYYFLNNELLFLNNYNFHNIDNFLYLYLLESPLFITASLILMVSLIGSIKLTLTREATFKRQNIYKQVLASSHILKIKIIKLY